MMNYKDLEFIKESHIEIRTMREKEVILNIRKFIGKHIITDEYEYENISPKIPAVVTKMTPGSKTVGNDVSIYDNITIVSGDIIADINLSEFGDIEELEDIDNWKFDSIIYDDVKYKVVSFGSLGLIESNRIELLCRREF